MYTRQLVAAMGRVDPHASGTVVALHAEDTAVPPHWTMTVSRRHLTYALHSVRIAAAHRPDEIIVLHISLMPVALVASLVSGARISLMTYLWELTTNRERAPRLLGNLANRVVAISRHSALEADRFLHGRVRRRDAEIAVLPNPIDTNAYRADPAAGHAFRSTHGIGGDDLVLLTVGRLDPTEREKGHERILRLLPTLLESFPRLRYVIAGQGGDKAKLAQIAADLDLEKVVIFAGFVDDLSACYSAADLYVMPSTQEGFGFVFAEAAACGVPVVAGGVDGSTNAVLWGEIGFLCDPYDPASIEHTIRYALERRGTGDPRTDPEFLRRRVIEELGTDAFDRRLAKLLLE